MKTLRILILPLLLSSCGQITVKGGTRNTVEGEAIQKIVLEIPACDALPEQEKLDCIRSFVDLFKTISDAGKACTMNSDGTLPNSEACQAIKNALMSQTNS